MESVSHDIELARVALLISMLIGSNARNEIGMLLFGRLAPHAVKVIRGALVPPQQFVAFQLAGIDHS